ncbi:hypothetical protein RhiTH_011379 [Rhizoctonia solani]
MANILLLGPMMAPSALFDSRSGDLVLGPLKGHEAPVRSVVFSPDGSHIVSGSLGSKRSGVGGERWSACMQATSRPSRLGYAQWHTLPTVDISSQAQYDLTIRVWKAPGGGVVSDLSHSAPSASDERQTHRAIAGGLTVSPDGWVRNRDSQLVFWAPSDIRRLFPVLETVYTIGPEGVLHTDYTQPLLLGEEWDRCYVGSG